MAVTLLRELGERLQFDGAPPVYWVVCGGTALALQRLTSRATRDVDVLCAWDTVSRSVVIIDRFDEVVASSIREVANRHPQLSGLSAEWVNLGASTLARHGLPPGFEQRLIHVEFGPQLSLALLGRQDLIALKLYAASDRSSRRQAVHAGDLRGLTPTFAELDFAVEWMRRLPDYEPMRPEVQAVLEGMGFDDLAYYV